MTTQPSPDPQAQESTSSRADGTTWGDAVQFLGALLGILLVGITPNPPVTLRDWLQILAGATLTAALTTTAVRDRVRRSAKKAQTKFRAKLATRLRGWRVWAWVLAAAVLAVVVAVAVPLLGDTARGLSYRVLGCPAPVQLRVLSEPETVATAKDLTTSYERWTAETNHGCPTAEAYVFAADPTTIAEKVATTDGWSDDHKDALRIGPRPDVWLAATRREVEAATTAESAVAESVPVAHSPLVLAVPAGAPRPTGSWPQVFRQLQQARVALMRPDPRTTQVGRLATVLLYGRDPADPDAPQPFTVERSLDAARGPLPPGDAAELLCPGRTTGLGAATAVVATEQDVARYNQGAALGATCGRTAEPTTDRRLEAVYPDDTADADLQLVRLRWTNPDVVPVQDRAAEAFGRWLRSDPGRSALVGTGLRPTGAVPAPAVPLTSGYGVDPALATSLQPISAERWRDAYAEHEVAQLPSRLLFLVDTSSSMAGGLPDRPGEPPGRTRATAVADAVGAGLATLQEHDEFGLWLFPGGTSAAYTDAVRVGLRDAQLAAARDELARSVPGGRAPLFRAVTDGVTTLSAADAAGARTGTRALIVVTDGPDNASGITPGDAVRDVTGRGVRVVVVAIGRVRCAEAGLATLAEVTGGECVESDPADVSGRVQEFVTQLRGGQS